MKEGSINFKEGVPEIIINEILLAIEAHPQQSFEDEISILNSKVQKNFDYFEISKLSNNADIQLKQITALNAIFKDCPLNELKIVKTNLVVKHLMILQLPKTLKKLTIENCPFSLADVQILVLPPELESLALVNCSLTIELICALKIPESVHSLCLNNNKLGDPSAVFWEVPKHIEKLEIAENNFSAESNSQLKSFPIALDYLDLWNNKLNVQAVKDILEKLHGSKITHIDLRKNPLEEDQVATLAPLVANIDLETLFMESDDGEKLLRKAIKRARKDKERPAGAAVLNQYSSSQEKKEPSEAKLDSLSTEQPQWEYSQGLF